MDIKFIVHNVSQTVMDAKVEFQGQEIIAQVPVLRVELVGKDQTVGSLTLQFSGQDVETAKEKFEVDAEVTWTL